MRHRDNILVLSLPAQFLYRRAQQATPPGQAGSCTFLVRRTLKGGLQPPRAPEHFLNLRYV